MALAKFLFESGLELEQAAVCASRIGKRCGHCPTRSRFVKEACTDGCLRQGRRGQSGPQLLYTFAEDSNVRSGRDVNFMEVAALLAILSEPPMREVRKILGRLSSSADGTEHSAEHNEWSTLDNVPAIIPLFIYFCKWLSGLKVFPPLQWNEEVKIELSEGGIPLPRLLGGLKRIAGGDRAKANDIERTALLVISNLSMIAAFTNGSTITRQPAEASLVVSTRTNIMEQSPESVAHLYKCLVLTEKDIEEIFEPIQRSVKGLSEPLLDSDSAVAVVDLLRQFANAVGKAGDSLMHALQDANPDDLWNTNSKYGRKISCKKTNKKKNVRGGPLSADQLGWARITTSCWLNG